MRIGFDLRPAWSKHSRRRGVGKYTHQLAAALAAANQEHELVFFTTRGQPVPQPCHSNIVLRSLTRPHRLNWVLDCWQLPVESRSGQLELFQATEITAIPSTGAPRIWAHVHDLIPYLFWDQVGAQFPWDFRFALKIARRRFSRAALLITDSVHSQQDLCRELNLPEDRVKVIHAASHERFKPQPQERSAERIKRKYRISGQFLFYVGGTDFRKNLPRLVEAFALLRDRGFAGRLVLAGESFRWNIPETREIRTLIGHLGLSEWVDMPGYVPDEDLPDFYSACRVFVFPSLYEGFGLPVLEAIQCGAVVAASQASSIPEVGGGAVQYFDPESVESLVGALEVACADEGRRDQLQAAARHQAGRFSWQKTARQLLQLYATELGS